MYHMLKHYPSEK